MSQTPESDEDRQRVEPKLLEILVCPLTKTTLEYDAAARELISRAAGLAYPIRNGVPLMTVEAARPLDAPSPAADIERSSRD
jgi:uncharacterized protein YbaR (Trm112 family)